MDNLPNTQPQIPLPSNQSTFQIVRKSFWETKIAKALLICISIMLFVILIAGLNYFDVISPSQLAFLPKQTTEQNNKTSNQNEITRIDQSEQIKLYVQAQEFSNLVLQPKYIQKIKLEEFIFTQDGESVSFPSFISSWEISPVSLKLSVQYNFATKKIANIDLSLLVPHASDVSTATVNNILSPYILASKFNISCDPPNLAGNIICSSMLTANIDESRTGISFRSYPSQKEDTITLCQVFPGSNTYSWNHCLSP